MQSISVNTGEIRLAINDDPQRVIAFNPNDALFAEKFYRLMGDFKRALTEYQNQIEALENDKATNEDGVPVNFEERLTVLKNASEFIRKQIDTLFGPGTSTIVFGDSLVMDAYAQFFEGILPFIQKARTDKVAQYSNKHPRRK